MTNKTIKPIRKSIYIIASTFYPELSDELIKGAKKELSTSSTKGYPQVYKVPGAFEISGMAKIGK